MSRTSRSRSPNDLPNIHRFRSSKPRSPVRLSNRSRAKSPVRSSDTSRPSRSRTPVRSSNRSRPSQSSTPVRSIVSSRSRSPLTSFNRSLSSKSRTPVRSFNRSRSSRSMTPIRSSNRSRSSRPKSQVRSFNRTRSHIRSANRSRSSNRSIPSRSTTPVRSLIRSRSSRSMTPIVRSSNRSRSPSRDRQQQKRSSRIESTSGTSIRESKRRQIQGDSFPMSEERFLRRVLYLLVEIRDLMKNQTDAPSTSVESVSHNAIQTEEEFEDLDTRLESSTFKVNFKSLLKKIGGTDGNDHMKKAMLRTMTNSYMASLNMKGKRGKRAFGSSNLYQVIKETVLTSHRDYTESKFNEDVGKFLKYAPERIGGGGRKKKE